MPTKVSADTISDLTVKAGFSGSAKTAPPTPQQIIDQTRASLKARIESLAKSAAEAKAAETDPSAPPSPFEIAHQRALKNQQDFERIVADVPKGFRLAPVLYSKIEQNQNERVYDEFRREVKREFLKYVANNHAGELAALGICPHGIEQMKEGRYPSDQAGVAYAVNIDHIIERSGGGNMSLQKETDPLLPPGSGKTYLVNHFNNLLLMPEHVHDAKNQLNDAQQAAQTPYGSSKWVLMLVPETGPGRSGFVATPQNPGHFLHGVRKRVRDTSKKINKASWAADQLQQALDLFRKNPEVNAMLKSAEAVAARQRKTVLGLMQDEESTEGVEDKRRLKDAFNAAVARNPTQKILLDNSLRPAFHDAIRRIQNAYYDAVAEAPAPGENNLGDFLAFYRGEKITALRRAIEQLPLGEAVRLKAALQEIDSKIKPQPGQTPRL